MRALTSLTVPAASPGASHQLAHGSGPVSAQLAPTHSPGLASDAGDVPDCLQAALLPTGVSGGSALPPYGELHSNQSLLAPGSSQLSPNTDTSARCEAIEHQVHQIETQVLCECLLGTNRVARGWAWVELVFLWSLMGGRIHCPFRFSLEKQVFISMSKYHIELK